MSEIISVLARDKRKIFGKKIRTFSPLWWVLEILEILFIVGVAAMAYLSVVLFSVVF